MKGMNKKGFTLVELLATMVIIGLITAVAIPNVITILNNSRNSTYVSDAKRLVSLAEYKLRSDSSIEKPAYGQTVVMGLFFLDNSEFENAPYTNKSYDKIRSYVLITNDGGYKYEVTLLEEVESGKYRGIYRKSYDELYNSDAKRLVSTKTTDQVSVCVNPNLVPNIKHAYCSVSR